MWRPIAILAACLVAGTGCSGQMGLLMKANPCTELSFDPISKKFKFYTNDGRGLSADEISYGTDAAGGRTFSAKNLQITEKAVEVKDADTRAIAATTELSRVIIQETGNAVKNAIFETLSPVRGASGSIDTPIGKGSLQLGGATKPETLQPLVKPN